MLTLIKKAITTPVFWLPMTFVHLTGMLTRLSFMGARQRLAGGTNYVFAVPQEGFHMQEMGMMLGKLELNA